MATAPLLVRSALGGVTLGWDLAHTAVDGLRAAIEGRAMHLRLIIERMSEGGRLSGV